MKKRTIASILVMLLVFAGAASAQTGDVAPDAPTVISNSTLSTNWCYVDGSSTTIYLTAVNWGNNGTLPLERITSMSLAFPSGANPGCGTYTGLFQSDVNANTSDDGTPSTLSYVYPNFTCTDSGDTLSFAGNPGIYNWMSAYNFPVTVNRTGASITGLNWTLTGSSSNTKTSTMNISSCSGTNCQADLVFIVDSSSTMTSASAALCSLIAGVKSDLTAAGYSVTSRIVGVGDGDDENDTTWPDWVSDMTCAEERYESITPKASYSCTGTVCTNENWGEAVTYYAKNYPWRPCATRLIVPMSDESPWLGCATTTDSGSSETQPATMPACSGEANSDWESVQCMIDAATANKVKVMPVMAAGAECTGATNTMQKLANDAGDGTVYAYTDQTGLANAIKARVTASCGATAVKYSEGACNVYEGGQQRYICVDITATVSDQDGSYDFYVDWANDGVYEVERLGATSPQQFCGYVNVGADNTTTTNATFGLKINGAPYTPFTCVLEPDKTLAVTGCSPLAVDLAAFTAEATADGVMLAWETVSETNHAGFNVHRAASAEGPWTQLNAGLIPAAAPGSSEGRAYIWVDAFIPAGAATWYLLEDVGLDGTVRRHEPLVVTVTEPNAVRLAEFGAVSKGPSLAGGLAVLALVALGDASRRRRPKRR